MHVGTAGAQVKSVELRAPRAFGYLIGDEIRLQTQVAWDEGYTLVPASLPEPGPVTYWLDLKSIETREAGEGRYRIDLLYQTFYAPLGPRLLEVPGFTVVAESGDKRADARIPAWRFLMSPLRDLDPHKRGDAVGIREDAAPKLISLRRYETGAMVSALAAAILALGVAHHRAWWPFRRRSARPFTQAARAMRHRPASPERPEEYLTGLLCLHRAFDDTAGHRVLAEDVRGFLHELPRFAALFEDIEMFFRASHRAFFRADPQGAMASLSPERLIALSGRLAAAERESS